MNARTERTRTRDLHAGERDNCRPCVTSIVTAGGEGIRTSRLSAFSRGGCTVSRLQGLNILCNKNELHSLGHRLRALGHDVPDPKAKAAAEDGEGGAAAGDADEAAPAPALVSEPI